MTSTAQLYGGADFRIHYVFPLPVRSGQHVVAIRMEFGRITLLRSSNTCHVRIESWNPSVNTYKLNEMFEFPIDESMSNTEQYFEVPTDTITFTKNNNPVGFSLSCNVELPCADQMWTISYSEGAVNVNGTTELRLIGICLFPFQIIYESGEFLLEKSQ